MRWGRVLGIGVGIWIAITVGETVEAAVIGVDTLLVSESGRRRRRGGG